MSMTLEEAVQSTAITWGKVPTVNHYLAPDSPEQWPTPWELINDNHYCDLAICLGMFYSLALTQNTDDLELRIYNFENNYLPVCTVGKYAINMDHGAVVNIHSLPDQAFLIYHYKKVDLSSKIN